MKISRNSKTSLKLLLPIYISILIFSAYPLLRGIYIGFTNYRIGRVVKFNWFDNYTEIINSMFFLVSFKNLFFLTFISLPIIYIMSFTLALILDSKLVFKGFWRTIMIIPWAVPPVTKLVIWNFIFNPSFGHANYILKRLGFIDKYLGWTADKQMAIYTIITVIVWGCVPFMTLCILSGLQSIPKENYEAAKIDGANIFQEFRYITLPYCKNMTTMALILLFIWIMQDFPSQYLLTNGGPGTATMTPNVQAYFEGFRQGNFGIAAAYGNILIVIMLCIMYIYARLVFGKNRGEEL